MSNQESAAPAPVGDVVGSFLKGSFDCGFIATVICDPHVHSPSMRFRVSQKDLGRSSQCLRFRVAFGPTVEDAVLALRDARWIASCDAEDYQLGDGLVLMAEGMNDVNHRCENFAQIVANAGHPGLGDVVISFDHD